MPLSSIFNFNHFARFKPTLPPAFVGAVALVLGLELTVRLAPDKWLIAPNSYIGRRMFMEQEFFKKFEKAPPQVVVMGTSRAQYGFISRKLDDLLGLPPNSCINVSLPASHPLGWLDLYKCNRELLGKAKCVVLCVDEWTFTSGLCVDEFFRLKASLSDRLGLVQPVETVAPPNEPAQDKALRETAQQESLVTLRNTMLMDWAFNIRLKLRYLTPAIVNTFRKSRKALPPPDEDNMPFVEKHDHGEAPENKNLFIKRVREFYVNFDTHPLLTGEYAELMSLIRADGAKILLLHLPNRSQYQAVVEELKPREFAQHLRNTEELAKRYGAVFQACIKPQEMGAEDGDYRDYGHISIKGARAFTAWLAEKIKSEKLLEK